MGQPDSYRDGLNRVLGLAEADQSHFQAMALMRELEALRAENVALREQDEKQRTARKRGPRRSYWGAAHNDAPDGARIVVAMLMRDTPADSAARLESLIVDYGTHGKGRSTHKKRKSLLRAMLRAQREGMV